MSAPSFAPAIMKRPWLQRWIKPLSNWYTNAAGYRQLGLRYAAPRRITGRMAGIGCLGDVWDALDTGNGTMEDVGMHRELS